MSFWAAWCGDCRAQLEALAQMQVRYQDTGIELLTVSLDQSRREAAEVTEAIGVTSPVLHDAGGEVGRLYAVERMPTMLLIDREGVVREVSRCAWQRRAIPRADSSVAPRVNATIRQ